MRKMTEEVRQKIAFCRKSRLDISEVIKEYELKDEDVSGCIIKTLERINKDISNCNMSNCIIGEENKKVTLSGSNLTGCNFKNSTFLGIVEMRRVTAQSCNFSESFVPFVEYQHGDFRNCNFCDTVWRFGSRAGHGAQFTKTVFDKWGLKIE